MDNPLLLCLVTDRGQMPSQGDCFGFRFLPGGGIQRQIRMPVAWIPYRAGDNLWAGMSTRGKQQNYSCVEEYDRFLHNLFEHRAKRVVVVQQYFRRSNAESLDNRKEYPGLEQSS